MYRHFGLVLMVTHDCNLRCTYCYTGLKSSRRMSLDTARKAIDRALGSIEPGGTLELGFTGGEPLLEAGLILATVDYARYRAGRQGVHLALSMTTNGSLHGAAAWSAMTLPGMDLALSLDGLPDVHNRHRRRLDGCGAWSAAVRTLHQLVDAGRAVRTVTVVRPDTVEFLPAGILLLKGLGVQHVEPSLDVWADWTREDGRRLELAIAECAAIWKDGLPDFGIGWFDEKLAQMAHVPIRESARCGFGAGELAVAPSGNLYPCERLIGEDADDSPMRLPGHVPAGDDFLDIKPAPCRSAAACKSCDVKHMCNTSCRCANYVRTGDVTSPDGLLCLLNRACLRETVKALALTPEPAVA